MSDLSPSPIVALVGRTNVGKSSLFNRLTETQDAIVSNASGTTRDRKEGKVLWRGQEFSLIDTGGLDVNPDNIIDTDTMVQTNKGIEEADLVVFMLDARTGPLPQEYEIADLLQKSGKPVLVVANKAEKSADRTTLKNPEWRLKSLPLPMAVSASQGIGTGDLLDEIFNQFALQKKSPTAPKKEVILKVAMIGRPNVGKSSLVNALLDDERVIVSPTSHTTREPNDILVTKSDKKYMLIDTAGMRKKQKVRKTGGLEKEGVSRTRLVLRRCDVALFIVDATVPIGNQERVLAGELMESKAGVIIVVNKWDLVPDKGPSATLDFKKYLAEKIPFLRWAPIVFVSAKTQQRVEKLFPLAETVNKNRSNEVPYKELNQFLAMAVKQHLPSRHKGPAHPKIIDMVQIGIVPPTFQLTLRAHRTDVLHPSYLRFLENRLRETVPLEGTPIRLRVRSFGEI